MALDAGCVSLAAGVLRLHPAEGGAPRVLARKVGAVARQGPALLVTSGRQVRLLDVRGQTLARYAASHNVTALARVGHRLVLGYRDGAIELARAPDTRAPGYAFDFEDTPASPVVALTGGPPGTVVAGFGNGVYGLWSLATGTALVSRRLHGPVRWLLLHRGRLHAATTLGQHDTLDLRIFTRPRCALLKEIWKQVAVTWQAGHPVRRPPPPGHPCAR